MLFNSQEEVMMFRRLIVVVGIVLASTAVYAGNVVWFGTEDDGYGSFGKIEEHGLNDFSKPYRVNIVNKSTGHPVRAGKQSIRFEVRAGDCGGDSSFNDCSHYAGRSERSELGMWNQDKAKKQYWYSWSYYFKNYKNLSDYGIGTHHGQWKQFTKKYYDVYDKKVRTGSADVLMFTTHADGLRISASQHLPNHKTYLIIPNKEMNNKWSDIVLNIKWSQGGDGFIRVYRKGKLIVDHRGPNILSNDPLTFRFGIYRPMVQRAGGPLPTHTVYYDEIMRGNSCQSVSMFQDCRFTPKKKINVHDASLNPTKPTVKINDYAHSHGDRFWGLSKGSILGQEILEMAGAIPNYPNMFSFDKASKFILYWF